MSSPTARDPTVCDEKRCNPRINAAWYCIDCDASFCEACWSETIAHRPREVGGAVPVGRDGLPHEKTNYYTAQKFIKILSPPKTDEAIQVLHREDERSTWFGRYLSPCHCTP